MFKILNIRPPVILIGQFVVEEISSLIQILSHGTLVVIYLALLMYGKIKSSMMSNHACMIPENEDKIKV